MPKLSLENLTSQYASVSQLNANFQAIEDYINQEALSRANSAGEDNFMDSDLDMNSYRILNLPEPLSSNEPVRLVDLNEAIFEGVDGLVPIEQPRQLGDGVTTVFSTPATGSIPAALLHVRLNGSVMRANTEFTYNSSTGDITFVDGAPNLNAEIDVTYFKPAFISTAYSTTADITHKGNSLETEVDARVPTVATLGELQGLSILSSGDTYDTKGYYAAGDGGAGRYLIRTAAEYGGTPDGFGDVYVGGGTSLVAERLVTGPVDVRSLGWVNDGDYDAGTGTVNTSAMSALSLFAERRGGCDFVAHGNYRGKLKINRSGVRIRGSATIWNDDTTIAFEIEAINGSTNLGPFLGEPWNYPEDLAPAVTLHRLTTNVTQGDRSITVDTTSGLQVGMTGVIISGQHTIATPAVNHIPQLFQFVKINGLAPNTIILNEEAYSDMNVVPLDTYFVQWPMVEGVVVDGLTVKNREGAVYCHRFSGIWDGCVNITVEAETAGGAIASCKKLHYGVDIQRGFNGISTARMSEDITINSVVRTGRDNSGGTSEELTCFLEENPRNIYFDKFIGKRGRLNVYGTSAHTHIWGNVDIDGYDRAALFLTTLEDDTVIDLRGRLVSDNPSYTARSQSVGKCNVTFTGTIRNGGGGKAWEHDAGSSNTRPMLRVRANADFTETNYVDSVRTDVDREKKLTRDSTAPVGFCSVSVSGTTPTKDLSRGIIGNVTRTGVGRYTVILTGGFTAGTEYAVQVSARGGASAIWQKFSGQVELDFKDSTGAQVDPTVFDVLIHA